MSGRKTVVKVALKVSSLLQKVAFAFIKPFYRNVNPGAFSFTGLVEKIGEPLKSFHYAARRPKGDLIRGIGLRSDNTGP